MGGSGSLSESGVFERMEENDELGEFSKVSTCCLTNLPSASLFRGINIFILFYFIL